MPWSPDELAAAYDSYAPAPSPATTGYSSEQLSAAYDAHAHERSTRMPGSVAEAIGGTFTKALDGLTFGNGDEIVAGGNAAIDYAMGQDEYSKSYDRYLATTRAAEQSVENAAPIASTVMEIGTSFKNPVLAAAKVRSLKGALKLGSATGAAYGFGEGEGGIANRVADAARGGALGAAFGGGIYGAAKVGSKVVGALGSGAEDMAQGFRENTLGIRASDIKKSFKKGTTFYDDTGIAVSADDAATDLSSKLDQHVGALKNDGFFTVAGNSGKSVKLAAEKRSAEIGKNIGTLVNEADSVVKTAGIKVKFRPDWSGAETYISEIRTANPSLAKTLQRELGGIRRNWTDSRMDFASLAEFKTSLGKVPNVFGSTQSESVMNAMKRRLYNGFKKTMEDNFTKILPGKGNALKEANKLYEAYQGVKDPIINRMAESVIGKLFSYGNLGLGGSGTAIGYTLGSPVLGLALPAVRAASKFAPNTSASIAEKSAGKLNSLSNGLSNNRFISRLGMGGIVANTATSDDQVGELPSFVSETNEAANLPPRREIPLSPLVSAVIRAESAGKANAVSPLGAQGLMQLMPATGKEWHGKLSLPGKYSPFNAEQNVKIGSAYLDMLLKKYDGNVRVALAAYNAGMGNVDKAIKKGGSDNWSSVKSFLPKPKETVPYVNKIVQAITSKS